MMALDDLEQAGMVSLSCQSVNPSCPFAPKADPCLKLLAGWWASTGFTHERIVELSWGKVGITFRKF